MSLTPRPLSPYERALGSSVRDLHPTLRSYFRLLPDGSVGIGEGVFTEIGTKQWWLRPLLRLLTGPDVLYHGYAREVPFHVVNRAERGSITAERHVIVEGKTWSMYDRVTAASGSRIRDVIGRSPRVAALFSVDVTGDALRLVSERAGLRIGSVRLRIPRALSPRITLIERFDVATGMQHVSLSMAMPGIGSIYGYHGHFTYRIEDSHE